MHPHYVAHTCSPLYATTDVLRAYAHVWMSWTCGKVHTLTHMRTNSYLRPAHMKYTICIGAVHWSVHSHHRCVWSSCVYLDIQDSHICMCAHLHAHKFIFESCMHEIHHVHRRCILVSVYATIGFRAHTQLCFKTPWTTPLTS